jgi:hypothetical protein
MAEIHRLAVHQRTAADDAVDAARSAFAHGFLADAARAKGAVEPDVGDFSLAALAYDLDGDVGARRD